MEKLGEVHLKIQARVDISDKVELFGCYLEKTHIRGTTKSPLFDPLFLNQGKAAAEGLARTNYAVEAWHFGIQSLFIGSHPNVWNFIQRFM